MRFFRRSGGGGRKARGIRGLAGGILSRLKPSIERRVRRRRPEYIIVEELLKPEPVIYLPFKPEYEVVSSYYVYEPFAKIVIARLPDGTLQYFVEEAKLTPEERGILQKLSEILLDEMKIEEPMANIRLFVLSEFRRIVDKYAGKFKLTDPAKKSKIMYYLSRNLIGYGPLEPLMRDPNIEDISCGGANLPVYVWHREYEYIPTNIVFTSIDYLNELIARLAHLGGRHVSTAFPIVDAILPGGHRLAATYGLEVSSKGPTFTIRKFREKPITITELIAKNVISPVLAGYLWFLIENKRTILIAGGTGSGKTTLLNAILSFVKPGMKIVTIEDIPELKLQHDNWTQLVARPSFTVAGVKSYEISLFDLVKLSLRYRPDYIVVGEIRGEEAFVLFQSVATGHGGITTIHGESLDYVIKRLTSPPMNIPPSYISLINAYIHIEKVIRREPTGRVVVLRRVREADEIIDVGKYIVISKWDPVEDRHIVDLRPSKNLNEIAMVSGQSMEEILYEIMRRSVLLEALTKIGFFEPSEINRVIYRYYYDPMGTFKRIIGIAGMTIEEAEERIEKLLGRAEEGEGAEATQPS